METKIIHEPTKSEFKRMAEQLGYEKVVRCRDCKYREDRLYCRINPKNPIIVTNVDFCSRGERKESSLFQDIRTGLEQAIGMEKSE